MRRIIVSGTNVSSSLDWIRRYSALLLAAFLYLRYTMALTAHEIGKDLIEALGLPKMTRSFTLRVRANEAVTVECEYYPDDGKAITIALMAYDLVPRFRPVPTAAPSADPVHFDTWYRHRINVAHAKFMERTSYHCPCDWRVFPPEAIEKYINGAGV